MSKVHEVKLGDIFFVPYPGSEKGTSMFIAMHEGYAAFQQGISDTVNSTNNSLHINSWAGVKYMGNIFDLFIPLSKGAERESLGERVEVGPWPVDKK